MPPGNPLIHLRRAIENVPENVAIVCMVIQNPVARYITEITMKIAVPFNKTRKYIFVQTLDEAYAHIQTQEALGKNA
jgi:hypothetical protein